MSFVRANFRNNSVAYRASVPGSTTGSSRGGAYHASGADLYTVADSCVFESNEAGAVGGALALDGGTFSATNFTFSDNLAGNGGAIAASEDEDESPAVVFLRGGVMRRNTAEKSLYNDFYGYGGALRAEEGSKARLYDVAVEENSGAFGGAVSVWAESRVSCSSVNFSSNVAEYAGGAVQVWGNASQFESEGCMFVGNAADGVDPVSGGSGGTDDTALSTSAAGSGGTGSSTTVFSSSASGTAPTRDSAGAAGGAISATDMGWVFLTDCTLSRNVADGRAGGVYCGSAGNVTAVRVDFEGHRSGVGGHGRGHGGALSAVDGCHVSLVLRRELVGVYGVCEDLL